MMVSKDDTKARRGFCALLLAGLGILAVSKGTDTLALKDGLLAALVLLACGLAVQRLPKRARAFVLLAAVPVLAQCLQAVSTDIGVFLYFKLVPKLWALVLWLVLFCLLWGLLGRPGIAGGVCVTISGLLALLNLALLQFRGTALQWQDIGSWRAALNVAGGYRLALSPQIVVLAVLWLWTLAALHWAGGLCAGAPRSAGFRAALGLGAAAAGVLLWVSPLIPASGVTSSYISTQNAFVANLFLQSRDLPLKKPKNYEAQLQQLEQRPRKTYVVFFGDHQPWVDEAFYSQYESEQDAQEHLRYQVPYFIWCNQSQEEQQLPLCGLNDLQLYLAGQAGLPLTGYQKLLAQVAQRYPVVCAQGVMAADGSWLDEKQIAEDDLLSLYRTAVYAHMNEPERLENFWTYAAG